MTKPATRSAILRRAALAFGLAAAFGLAGASRAFEDGHGGGGDSHGGPGVPTAIGGVVSGPGPSGGHDARGGGGGGPVSGAFGGGLGPGMGVGFGHDDSHGGPGGGRDSGLSGSIGPGFGEGHGGQFNAGSNGSSRGRSGDDRGGSGDEGHHGGLSGDLKDLVSGVFGKGKDGEREGHRALGSLADDAAQVPLVDQRRVAVQHLLKDHADLIEADPFGHPAVRGEVLAVSPAPEAVAKARHEGFRIVSRETLAGLDMTTLVLAPPRGMTAGEAVRRLRALDPQGQYDFNHLYQEGGAVSARRAAQAPPPATAATASGVRIGLVDGSVSAGQPAMAGVHLVQQPFAPGGAHVTAHATAVASLIAGAGGRFRSAAPGATLFVADVYGPTAAGGSAEAIARALSWLAQAKTPVINISLVGPPNLALGAAVEALIRRGYIVVAAVGNDGPAAPPLYPASYPGVIAVTAVDARRHLLPEAGRGAHVDFAAPGADMAAAGLDGGFVSVRGTSFAAPIVTGLLARMSSAPDPATAAQAIGQLGREALTPRLEAALYGRGIVGDQIRTLPTAVGARLALRGP